MIIENLLQQKKEPSHPCLALHVYYCIVCWLASMVAVLILTLPNPSDDMDEGDYAYLEDPEVDGQGDDEDQSQTLGGRSTRVVLDLG